MTIKLRNLGNLGDGLKNMRQALVRAATADVTQRARTVLVRDLPAWLAELGMDLSVVTPLDLDGACTELTAHLDQLARVCGTERNTLRAWHPFGGHRALTLKLSLDRVVGALVPLEAALARCALALRRSDPRLAAIGASTAPASALGRTTVPPGSVPSGPLATLSPRDYRTLAEHLRGVLYEATRAATAIQRAVDRERSTNSRGLAGAIEQTQTLAAWLRQECDGTACHLLRRADG